MRIIEATLLGRKWRTCRWMGWVVFKGFSREIAPKVRPERYLAVSCRMWEIRTVQEQNGTQKQRFHVIFSNGI